jgi:hypothetical protein
MYVFLSHLAYSKVPASLNRKSKHCKSVDELYCK